MEKGYRSLFYLLGGVIDKLVPGIGVLLDVGDAVAGALFSISAKASLNIAFASS